MNGYGPERGGISILTRDIPAASSEIQPRPRNFYEFYTREPLVRNAKSSWAGWQLIDTKIENPNAPFDPNNPETYRRLVFNPFDGEHKLLTEQEVSAIRETTPMEISVSVTV